MLPSEANGLKWVGVSLILKTARDICLQRRTRRHSGLVLRNAERQERFAAGTNLFWFDEGICPGGSMG
ncbi:MAG: hypothetical protein A3G51_03010 [Candidatus Yanofskybacteria bacterium RIFCSPLOWO2_12_FULL_43_11b]|uniref:Uncharacterized protein n=1 Tax=Candidatus Yanofskybacteria bacterium RIFCSPLOWO2_12_FULL_43_11b TaxID=1802710 RepID=A0A1F8H997_9BACT|nr:MAG: hypothetical protein A2742_00690 [Candidatus Yanofskybacteria bacterium RIFCSPHIGHO2_01_FULL_43_32]OGN11281.1 MAG: hypothetical protein A3C69_00825 [Candidatus Yanofskybacteria bacterium RIFCSPHIGHO2_02_FULL_43_12]OGN17604.1 MAG: hypothetical protein A3E34_01465 [Candidatus Yanofskybacteria bacterium RIFCSPHIGHO2_12_FULL_43_11]OGN24202.1 MAG: hypothetical protein A2923_02630 [Candidatus Yanofskybacteria bacterium RIFCSPLOWO2_01_FULL_43_46]OGN34163.1 MAG: hypothetical protein A3G51_03010